jgi:hypothetical protein
LVFLQVLQEATAVSLKHFNLQGCLQHATPARLEQQQRLLAHLAGQVHIEDVACSTYYPNYVLLRCLPWQPSIRQLCCLTVPFATSHAAPPSTAAVTTVKLALCVPLHWGLVGPAHAPQSLQKPTQGRKLFVGAAPGDALVMLQDVQTAASDVQALNAHLSPAAAVNAAVALSAAAGESATASRVMVMVLVQPEGPQLVDCRKGGGSSSSKQFLGSCQHNIACRQAAGNFALQMPNNYESAKCQGSSSNKHS